MIIKRAPQRAIRLGEQDLERWGYSVEALAFLGLATIPGATFATLRDIRGPAGLAALLENHSLPTRVSHRAIAAVSKLASSRTGIAALQKKGLSVARNLIRHGIARPRVNF
jgi:hypothetical protein